MATVRQGYMSPWGKLTLDPTPELLRERLFTKGERYTAGNAGAAWLGSYTESAPGEWSLSDDQPALVIFAKKKYGFFVGWTDDGGEHQWAPYDGSGIDQTVEHAFEGGERDATVPAGYFVATDVAREIVQEFCRSGERSGRVQWAELHALGFPME